jgi:CspA family cold shock protein
MPSGRVKFFNTERGYGFIAPDGGGSDVFVHVHEVEAAGMKMLVAGQLVRHRVINEIGDPPAGQDKCGSQACAVSVAPWPCPQADVSPLASRSPGWC